MRLLLALLLLGAARAGRACESGTPDCETITTAPGGASSVGEAVTAGGIGQILTDRTNNPAQTTDSQGNSGKASGEGKGFIDGVLNAGQKVKADVTHAA